MKNYFLLPIKPRLTAVGIRCAYYATLLATQVGTNCTDKRRACLVHLRTKSRSFCFVFMSESHNSKQLCSVRSPHKSSMWQ
jgi:hypothetical protein